MKAEIAFCLSVVLVLTSCKRLVEEKVDSRALSTGEIITVHQHEWLEVPGWLDPRSWSSEIYLQDSPAADPDLVVRAPFALLDQLPLQFRLIDIKRSNGNTALIFSSNVYIKWADKQPAPINFLARPRWDGVSYGREFLPFLRNFPLPVSLKTSPYNAWPYPDLEVPNIDDFATKTDYDLDTERLELRILQPPPTWPAVIVFTPQGEMHEAETLEFNSGATRVANPQVPFPTFPNDILIEIAFFHCPGRKCVDLYDYTKLIEAGPTVVKTVKAIHFVNDEPAIVENDLDGAIGRQHYGVQLRRGFSDSDPERVTFYTTWPGGKFWQTHFLRLGTWQGAGGLGQYDSSDAVYVRAVRK